MTTQLKLYNKALLICSERQLATVTDAVEARYLLDSAWNDGAVDACLAVGFWRFATRSQSIDSDAGIDPAFGYAYAFQKPSDWVNGVAICVDEYYRSPLTDYAFEAGYWYADTDPIYVRYVSNDATYGTDYSNWPALFADFVAASLAARIVKKLTADKERRLEVNDALKAARSQALNHDAMNAPPTPLPSGSWTRGRRGRGGREGGGNRNSLLG